MLRILEEGATDNGVTLRLDGRLAGEWVTLLRSSCQQIIDRNARLMLDLSGVSFADQSGVRLLRQLDERQAALLNCSPFLQEQLKPRA